MLIDTATFLCFVTFFVIVVADGNGEYRIEEQPEQCPYYGEGNTRHVVKEHGLVNCTWYTGRSCCKRTEVTSVFSSMFPLFGASLACKHRINYLMCYFCDPEQHRWIIDKKPHVCADFCRSVFVSCQDAEYEGKSIGEEYRNGTSFCESQNFHVVEGDNCFDYDPTVFGMATIFHHANSVVLCLALIAIHVFIKI